MTAGLAKVRSGDPLRITAVAWNALVDTALAEQARASLGADTAQGAGAGGLPSGTAGIWVRNETTQDWPRWTVVALGNALLQPGTGGFLERPLVAATPALPWESEVPVALLPGPILAGRIGPAVLQGVVALQVLVADADDLAVEVADDGTGSLVTAQAGPGRILWKETGTGLRWALVQWLPARQPWSALATIESADAIGAVLGQDPASGVWSPIDDTVPGDRRIAVVVAERPEVAAITPRRVIAWSGIWPADGAPGTIWYAGSAAGVVTDTPPTDPAKWTRRIAVQVTGRLRCLTPERAVRAVPVDACENGAPSTLTLPVWA